MEGPKKRIKNFEEVEDDNFEMARLHVGIAGNSEAARYLERAKNKFSGPTEIYLDRLAEYRLPLTYRYAFEAYEKVVQRFDDLIAELNNDNGIFVVGTPEEYYDSISGLENSQDSTFERIYNYYKTARHARKLQNEFDREEVQNRMELRQTTRALIRGPAFTEGMFRDDPHIRIGPELNALSDEELNDDLTDVE